MGAALTRFESLQTECRTPIESILPKVADLASLLVDKRQNLKDVFAEWAITAQAYAFDRDALTKGLASYCKTYAKAPITNTLQHKARQGFDGLADSARGLSKQIDLLYKFAVRAVQSTQELASDEAVSKLYERIAVSKSLKQLEEARKAAIEQLKLAGYFHRQIAWLQDRFPKAEMADVLGLCKVVTQSDIETADWSLAPGRYVGIATNAVDEDFDFEQTMRDIDLELTDLNLEASILASRIHLSFEGLGI